MNILTKSLKSEITIALNCLKVTKTEFDLNDLMNVEISSCYKIL